MQSLHTVVRLSQVPGEKFMEIETRRQSPGVITTTMYGCGSVQWFERSLTALPLHKLTWKINHWQLQVEKTYVGRVTKKRLQEQHDRHNTEEQFDAHMVTAKQMYLSKE